MTRDPAKDGFNWYKYCGNKVTIAVDPQGHFFILVALAVGAATYFVVKKGVEIYTHVNVARIAGEGLKDASWMAKKFMTTPAPAGLSPDYDGFWQKWLDIRRKWAAQLSAATLRVGWDANQALKGGPSGR